jgi:quercetin 2,3-dioxygenase
MGDMVEAGVQTAPWRAVTRVVEGRAASDGAGVRLTRVIGTSALPDLDPFLLFDEFGSDSASDYIAGFPDHPHRGFETVTYMLAGRMRHRDNHGNSGLLESGGAQWMTAGRGIVHSEMPEQESGLMRGFQLWVNLPARDKMAAPRYQDVAPAAIPEVAREGGTVRVLAGTYGGVTGPMRAAATRPTYLDVHLPAGGSFAHDLPEGDTAFIYVYDGAIEIGAPDARQPVCRSQLAVLGDGARVGAKTRAPARFVLVAGRKLNEPVARYGPFVMNTQAELRQAFLDFQEGRF